MTVRPSRADFHALAATHTVVPVWREVVADLETPVSAFLKLVGPTGTTVWVAARAWKSALLGRTVT
ncbi:MAG TPA: hypothetical protein VNT52_04145, partial [Acidimicrobiales bacterium]|nr:hypothetical protein [Acidimicrobiales bacterium]